MVEFFSILTGMAAHRRASQVTRRQQSPGSKTGPASVATSVRAASPAKMLGPGPDSPLGQLLNAPGLSPDEVKQATTIIGEALLGALSKRDRQRLRDTEIEMAARVERFRELAVNGDKAEALVAASGAAREGIYLHWDVLADVGGVPPLPALTAEGNGTLPREKQAIRAAIAVMAQTSPTTLAAVMGIAPATLYAYADEKRPGRPGKKQLHLAAFYFRYVAYEARRAADALDTIAPDAIALHRGRPATRSPVGRDASSPGAKEKAGHAAS
jgi:hypothetical protein